MLIFRIFIIVLTVIIGSGILIVFQIYPIAIVDFHVITAKYFNEVYSASLNYYEEAQKVYGGDSKILQSEETRKEIKRALLESLIEDVLIDKELRKELSAPDLERLVANKINTIERSENIEKSAAILYGFSYDAFREKVLEPMAKKDILEGRLYLNNRNSYEYLKVMKKEAEIIILLPGFHWNGEGVIIK